MLTCSLALVTPVPMIGASPLSPSQPLAFPRPKTASGGLRPIPRHRLSHWASQPTDASGKNRPSYDRPRRRSHLPQSNQPKPCISLSDGPVLLQGGGGDITLATGGGVSAYKFKIPSTGAEGTVTSGSWLFGAGSSLSADALSVKTFGQLLGDGYRFEAGIGFITGHITWDAEGNRSGGGLSFGAGGGVVGGLTKTTLKSSNRPICGAN